MVPQWTLRREAGAKGLGFLGLCMMELCFWHLGGFRIYADLEFLDRRVVCSMCSILYVQHTVPATQKDQTVIFVCDIRLSTSLFLLLLSRPRDTVEPEKEDRSGPL